MDILNNPNIDPSQYEEIMEEQMMNSFIPPQFSYLNAQFRSQLENESWKWLKFTLNWHPTDHLNTEYSCNVEMPNRIMIKNYNVNITSLIFDRNNQQNSKGFALLARKEMGGKLIINSQYSLNTTDKIIAQAHYMNSDYNQGAYEFEYNKKIDRMSLDAKYSTANGISLSGVTAIGKGAFLGFEVLYNSKAPKLMYNYGFKFTPYKNVQIAGTYINFMPFYMLDILYKYKKIGFFI